MKKLLALLLLVSTSVFAGHGGHGNGSGHFGGVRGPGYFVGGVIAGAVIVDVMTPRYYPTPYYYPLVYVAPPTRITWYCDVTRSYYYPGAACPTPWREVYQ